jgi:hypothetical protein
MTIWHGKVRSPDNFLRSWELVAHEFDGSFQWQTHV